MALSTGLAALLGIPVRHGFIATPLAGMSQ